MLRNPCSESIQRNGRQLYETGQEQRINHNQLVIRIGHNMTRETLLNTLREIPILGGLIDCGGQDHWESLGQTTVLFVLSSMPIWLGTLIVYATGDKVGHGAVKTALLSTVGRGELFMYSTAFLAPIFWIALTDRPNMRVFPGKVSHIVLMVIISVIAAVFFGLQTAGNRLIQPFTFDLSVWMF